MRSASAGDDRGLHPRNVPDPRGRDGALTVDTRARGLATAAPPIPRLEVRNLSKTFSGQPALDGLDLCLQRGEVHALVGENGSGKSTFIKILAGYHLPDTGGRVLVDGLDMAFGSAASARTAGFRFVHQDLALSNGLSIADNLSIGTYFASRCGTIRRSTELERARHDLRRSGLLLDPRTLVGDLTPAQRTRVAVARALREDPDAPPRLLVLDEPTANLEAEEVERLLDTLRRAASDGVSVIYVSHRLDEIFRVADNVTVLRDGQKVATRNIAGLDRPELISLLVGNEFEEAREVSAQIEAQTTRQVIALEVTNLTSLTLKDVSLVAHEGEILGVAGITGSGRETVLGAIFGALPRYGGTVRIGSSVLPPDRPDRAVAAGVALIPADRKVHGAFLGLTGRENLTVNRLRHFWHGWRLDRKAEREDAASWFGRLSVRPADAIDKAFSTFSGGNQQKIVFAKWLSTKPRVILLDEPTQGVDVGAKAELYSIIQKGVADGAAAVVTSSDTDELYALCQRVLVLRNGRVAAELTGQQLTVANLTRAVLGADPEGDQAA